VKKRQENSTQPLTEYLSFSGVKDWEFCPRYYKLSRIDKLYKFEGNIHTAFGTSVHTALEFLMHERNNKDKSGIIEKSKLIFSDTFDKELSSLKEEVSEKDVSNMQLQGTSLLDGVLDFMKNRYGNYEVLFIEEELSEDLEFEQYSDIKFKGFIDLVIRTSDKKIHIIDWKTCSWGWPWQKRSDPMTTYQLTYYKNFFAKKYGFDLKQIETCFILLKRTAKKDVIEAVKISSGQKKTNNALNLLETAIHNIEKGNHIKKKTSCQKCDLWKTLCEG